MLGNLLRKIIPAVWRPVRYLENLTRRRAGGRVLRGPFAGMRYIRSSHFSTYIPKLLGSYEKELAAAVETACGLQPDAIIDAGAAEGYYAVGLALRNPATRVTAFEMEAEGRRALGEMVRLNAVDGRVQILGKCEPADLQKALAQANRPLVVCDVEGYELALLDPMAVPALSGAHILVELHDFLHRGLAETVEPRFAMTHRVTRIWQEQREANEFPFATWYTRLLPKAYLRWAVSEWRPERMSWFWMEPLPQPDISVHNAISQPPLSSPTMIPADSTKPLKVFLVCTGVGVLSRGIETFARECFDGLRGSEGLQLELFKGAGPEAPPDEHRLPCLPRSKGPARVLGTLMRRTPYVAEQLSSLLPLIRRLRAEQPDVVFTSEGNLRRWLYLLRPRLGLTCRILFSNGGPVRPPFPDSDHVQQTTPFHLQEALAAGEPPEKHSLVPYGIHVSRGKPVSDPGDIAAIRRRTGLPVDRPIILSVGSLSAKDHKRMDYTIREVASLPAPRPYLVLLGAMDANSAPILAQAQQQLGLENYLARSVAADEVEDYYQAADVFVLGSLQEGFGRVYLEALMHGLPCAVNDHPIMRYVLGEEGTYADFARAGVMASVVLQMLADRAALLLEVTRLRRRESVRKRFDWSVLGPDYLRMFWQAAAGANPRVFDFSTR